MHDPGRVVRRRVAISLDRRYPSTTDSPGWSPNETALENSKRPFDTCGAESNPSTGTGKATSMLTDHFRDPMTLDRIQSTAAAPYLDVFADALTALCNSEGAK